MNLEIIRIEKEIDDLKYRQEILQDDIDSLNDEIDVIQLKCKHKNAVKDETFINPYDSSELFKCPDCGDTWID